MASSKMQKERVRHFVDLRVPFLLHLYMGDNLTNCSKVPKSFPKGTIDVAPATWDNYNSTEI